MPVDDQFMDEVIVLHEMFLEANQQHEENTTKPDGARAFQDIEAARQSLVARDQAATLLKGLD